MKIILIMVSFVLLFSPNLSAVENIILKDGIDYLEKLLDNQIYLKYVRDVDYENGSIYFLDGKFGIVFRVDFNSGALIKTLFRRGQGPGELARPISFKVKKRKVYVLDRGFNGIKIVDIDGNLINEFKIKGIIGKRNIDVNEKGEIFVGEYDSHTKTYIAVYNLEGKKIRSLIKLNSDPGSLLPLNRTFYQFRLDNDGNIILLFNILRELKKFNSDGELIWEKKINNKILDKFSKEDKISTSTKGTIRTKYSVFWFNIIENNNILIGHFGGGCLFDSNGVLKSLITFDTNHTLFLFKLIENKLITILGFGRTIFEYNIKEEIK